LFGILCSSSFPMQTIARFMVMDSFSLFCPFILCCRLFVIVCFIFFLCVLLFLCVFRVFVFNADLFYHTISHMCTMLYFRFDISLLKIVVCRCVVFTSIVRILCALGCYVVWSIVVFMFVFLSCPCCRSSLIVSFTVLPFSFLLFSFAVMIYRLFHFSLFTIVDAYIVYTFVLSICLYKQMYHVFCFVYTCM